MARKIIHVDYWKQVLGQRDQTQNYRGEAIVVITPTKVQFMERGLVVFELSREDWLVIAAEVDA